MENEELQRIDYGGSLPVENVQALASENLKEIPSRYVRPEAEFDQVSVEDHSLEIPTIDMSELLDEKHPLSPPEELARLHSACRDWGFFQVQSHNLTRKKYTLKGSMNHVNLCSIYIHRFFTNSLLISIAFYISFY